MDARALEVEIPLRIVSVANLREHWAAKHRRTSSHRSGAALAVRAALRRWAVGSAVAGWNCVTLARIIGPRGRTLDDDNLRSAFKAVRDGVADALGINDGSREWRWEYREERGKQWAVKIRIEALEAIGARRR